MQVQAPQVQVQAPQVQAPQVQVQAPQVQAPQVQAPQVQVQAPQVQAPQVSWAQQVQQVQTQQVPAQVPHFGRSVDRHDDRHKRCRVRPRAPRLGWHRVRRRTVFAGSCPQPRRTRAPCTVLRHAARSGPSPGRTSGARSHRAYGMPGGRTRCKQRAAANSGTSESWATPLPEYEARRNETAI